MAKTDGASGRLDLPIGGSKPVYNGARLGEIAFPLGGIGTGMITLGGWGQLKTWEIRNRPAKGARMPHGFFAVKVRRGKGRSIARVLQGPPMQRSAGGHSAPRHNGEGLPHFRDVTFRGEFPIATVTLSDEDVPVRATLEAFNPFIPLDPGDSSIPTAILLYRLQNTSRSTLEVTVAGNLTNILGERAGRVNEARDEEGLTGLWLSHSGLPKRSPDFGSIVLATPAEGATVLPRWRGAGWRDSLVEYWTALAEGDSFPPKAGRNPAGDLGTVAVTATLKPRGSMTVPFVIAWHFPTVAHWRSPDSGQTPTWRNYFATVWSDAWDVAAYVNENLERLHDETARFRDTLFGSTLPQPALDAVSSQLSTLKTPTCLRLTDGTFYGFEGCSDTTGCCEGSCTHVWNYAQALPYLFPTLQRSMHEASFANAMQPDGWVTFRMPLPAGTKAKPNFHPAADGQMGQVIQVYREWLLSGDDAWLKRIWPKAKKALEFAFKYWDANKDGVMEGMQHNTYDNEFHGPNTMMGSLYLCALRAAGEMAAALGKQKDAARYRDLAERGAAWTDQNLFNRQYYQQQVTTGAHKKWPDRQREMAEKHGKDTVQKRWPKWQFGTGCLSDQLIGQWYAHMLGLGHLYKRANVRKALQSVFKYNWRSSLRDHAGTFRLYALGDEPGLILCTWPKGGRPGQPFWFADEVWCGVEYQVASHLIYEGFVAEGLAVVAGVRSRHTGDQRNPWDEFECGHHYARSMASYAVLLALSGFSYSAPDERIGFDPRVSVENFRSFFCVPSGWGLYTQRVRDTRQDLSIEMRYGRLTLRQVSSTVAARAPGGVTVTLGRAAIPATALPVKGGLAIVFSDPVTIGQGETLRIALE